MSDELLHRLELFIRRYYKNQLLKGAILGSTGLLAVFLFVNVFEYYGRFSSGVRAFFFYGFIAFFLLVIWHYLARPLRGLFRLGNTMSHAEAARIIGSHFSHVSDKLLNLLQLREQAQHHPDNALLLAGITQKTTELRPVPFQAAVNFSENKKYLRYLALPLVALLCILLFQGSIISEGTKRLVSYNKEFPKQAPFAFQLLNSTLKFPRNTEVTLQLATPGTVIPAEMYLESEGQLIRMEQKGSGRFSLTLPPLEGNTSVRFVSGEFNSTEYLLELVPQPELAGAEITLDYPDYTGLETKTLYNTGDLNIPEGTTVKWKFSTRDAQALQMFFGRERIEVPAGESKGGFALSRKFLQSTPWGFLLLNPLSVNRDTAKHQLLVIPDHAPALATEYKTDSSTGTEWCIGTAGDDYGLSRAAFHVRILNSEDASRKGREMPAVSVPVDKSTQSVFSWPVSPEQLGLLPGEEAEYWFEVWDNDGIHGAKSTRSIPRKTSRKTENQLKNEADKTASGMKSKMEKAMSQAEEIRKQALEIQKKLAEQKTMQWDSKEKISQLMNKQKKLEENIEQIKKDNQKLNQQQKEFSKPDQELLQKQEELRKKMEELLTPEMKEMLKKLEELLQQNNKEQISKELEKMNLDNKEVNKELDRMLEEFKQLELEKKINEATEKLNELAQKQEKLADETLGKDQPQSELKEEQQKLENEFNELKQEIQDIKKDNKELESPMDLENMDEQKEEVSQDMDNAQDQLNQNKNNKASESQKGAAQKMKKMAEQMQQSLSDAQQKQDAEDYQKLREILENLIQLSEDQEQVMNELREVAGYNPKFVQLAQRQLRIREDAGMIEDSLLALSKRQPQISSFVNKEIGRINNYLEQGVKNMQVRDIQGARVDQQYVMTGLNELAVMLSESLKNMQEQMNSQSKSKSGMACKNPKKSGPGKKKAGMKGMKQMQEELGKQMSELQKQSGQGRKLSEQLAKSAAQQEALRREMERIKKEYEEQGKAQEAGSMQSTIDLMEQNEKDLVNKQITPELMNRQKEIETRMLEHEKAEQMQETEDKREAQQPQQLPPATPPPSIMEYIRRKKNDSELLRTVPPGLSPWYEQKAKEYLQNIR